MASGMVTLLLWASDMVLLLLLLMASNIVLLANPHKYTSDMVLLLLPPPPSVFVKAIVCVLLLCCWILLAFHPGVVFGSSSSWNALQDHEGKNVMVEDALSTLLMLIKDCRDKQIYVSL